MPDNIGTSRQWPPILHWSRSRQKRSPPLGGGFASRSDTLLQQLTGTYSGSGRNRNSISSIHHISTTQIAKTHSQIAGFRAVLPLFFSQWRRYFPLSLITRTLRLWRPFFIA